LPLESVPLVFASGPDDPDEPVEPLIRALRGAGVRQVVVTCGSRGASFSDGGAILHAPATPVRVVDTCGAGDSFIAAFLAAFCCEKRGPADSLDKATVTAAQTCLHVGGFPQSPRRIPDWLLTKYAAVTTPMEGR
jgi:fructoselysine 6-kinase